MFLVQAWSPHAHLVEMVIFSNEKLWGWPGSAPNKKDRVGAAPLLLSTMKVTVTAK